MKSENSPAGIVFFDGVCHLCNGFVDFVIQNETPPFQLVFAPLQGETARKLLEEKDRQELNSVILWQDGKIFRESEAILKIFFLMGGAWKMLSYLGRIFPAFFRDGIYHWVARNRYKWFGQRDFCRLPKPEEKSQLWP